ncbi:expressed unknown protein [Ectocarpus siliculosus]|uniref:Uncharacterized protein n=1 Tax=Ectocarpus siliculosus TaxID=2880 RepID=D8LQH9_ECTSI|nr:expressed unknown protein [Ectocarpus siliculosus]|eukprot:CBN78743.1 expressed unknown protein [Ectocarpus siliculosus]
MAEFMAKAHENRLQAMEAVKKEVQRGYEEQIADLQSKLAALPPPADADKGAAAATAFRAEEPVLVGVGQGASMGFAGGAAQHPSYAARSARPGWEARWGAEEPARASPAVTAADVSSMESRVAAASAPGGGAVHPAYAARAQRPGWEERWGMEEPARKTMAAASTSASAEVVPQAQGKAAAPADVHPAYAARTQRPGWEERWGAEEPARKTMTVAGAGSTSAPAEVATQALGTPAAPADVHPAYAARTQRPGWEERWGSEEPARMTAATATPTPPGPAASAQAQSTAASPPADVHPAYAARAQRPGWEARWGSEEPARMIAATSTAGAPTASGKTALPDAEDSHPAYAARSGRPGWEARWGSEEKERVAGADAGAIAVAGAAAGFATAGGLDAAASAAAADEASAESGGAGDDPLADEFLTDDVAELRSMVVSNRRSFQDYLLKSLWASNELKQSNAVLEAELSRSKVRLAAEEQLRESLQESFLGYMSRSGDAGAAGKAQVAKLEKDVLTLAAEADELRRFTQEYMVKASSDKQNALEEAAATARAQSAERIAALQAQVLELQAGG